MKKYLFIVFLVFIVLFKTNTCLSQTKKFHEYNYNELVEALNVKIKVPRGFHETPIIENNGHLYQHALKDSTTGFEVRYYLRPYKLFYDKKTEKDYKIDTYIFFMSSIYNISQNSSHDIIVINPEYVKHDMNAEYGLSSLVETGQKFTEGYKFCEAHAVRKDSVGEIFIFMLYNIQNRETQIIRDDIFSSLDFL